MPSIKFEGGPLDGKSESFPNTPDNFKIIIPNYGIGIYLLNKYSNGQQIYWKFKFQNMWVMDCWKCDKHDVDMQFRRVCLAYQKMRIKTSDGLKPLWCPIYGQREDIT